MLIPIKNHNTADSRESGFIKAAYKRTGPFGLFVLLLLITGYAYICRFKEGGSHAFCYIVLPILAGAFASYIFRKIGILESIAVSSSKTRAVFLIIFTAHIPLMSLLGMPNDFAPEMMLLCIPSVYSLYICVIPSSKGLLKFFACALFWAGTVGLCILRPTPFVGDGVFCIHVSMLLITLFAIKYNRFGHKNKGKKYFYILMGFAISYFVLTRIICITLFSGAIAFADISTASASEVIQNVGILPVLLLCAVYLAVIIFGFTLAVEKPHAMKYIAIGVTTSFALIFLLNILAATKVLSTNFGLPILECTELSTSFIMLFTMIILSPNDLSAHAFVDSCLYESPYTGNFRDAAYSKGRLLIVQGPTGSGKTSYLREQMEKEPGNVLYFTIETIYDRFTQSIHDCCLLVNTSPEVIFPEIQEETSISLIQIDDVDMIISGRPTTQRVLGHLLNLLMADWGISVTIAGIDLKERVPVLWDELTNSNKEYFCGAVSYVDI